MKVYFLILVLLISTIQLCYSQQKTPKNLHQALSILQTDCTDSLKALIQKTNDDKLVDISYPWSGEYKTIFNWLSEKNEGTRLSKYLRDNGITYERHQQTVILIAFKDRLLGKKIDEKLIFRPYQEIEIRWAKEDKVRYTTDTLRGVYIPKDMDDCFKQIDKLWKDSTKNQVKKWTEDEFVGKTYRLGLGLWMRNNWQLWGGSRLSKYFNQMGLYNAESISGIILFSYHRHLLGQNTQLAVQVNSDQKNRDETKQKDSIAKAEEFNKYKVGDTLNFNYNMNFVSKEQEGKADRDICNAKGVVIGKDEPHLFLRVKIIETCDKKGIIIYDNEGTLEYNKKLKKCMTPKKRIIKKGYKGDEFWFNYDSWESKDN